MAKHTPYNNNQQSQQQHNRHNSLLLKTPRHSTTNTTLNSDVKHRRRISHHPLDNSVESSPFATLLDSGGDGEYLDVNIPDYDGDTDDEWGTRGRNTLQPSTITSSSHRQAPPPSSASHNVTNHSNNHHLTRPAATTATPFDASFPLSPSASINASTDHGSTGHTSNESGKYGGASVFFRSPVVRQQPSTTTIRQDGAIRTPTRKHRRSREVEPDHHNQEGGASNERRSKSRRQENSSNVHDASPPHSAAHPTSTQHDHHKQSTPPPSDTNGGLFVVAPQPSHQQQQQDNSQNQTQLQSPLPSFPATQIQQQQQQQSPPPQSSPNEFVNGTLQQTSTKVSLGRPVYMPPSLLHHSPPPTTNHVELSSSSAIQQQSHHQNNETPIPQIVTQNTLNQQMGQQQQQQQQLPLSTTPPPAPRHSSTQQLELQAKSTTRKTRHRSGVSRHSSPLVTQSAPRSRRTSLRLGVPHLRSPKSSLDRSRVMFNSIHPRTRMVDFEYPSSTPSDSRDEFTASSESMRESETDPILSDLSAGYEDSTTSRNNTRQQLPQFSRRSHRHNQFTSRGRNSSFDYQRLVREIVATANRGSRLSSSLTGSELSDDEDDARGNELLYHRAFLSPSRMRRRLRNEYRIWSSPDRSSVAGMNVVGHPPGAPPLTLERHPESLDHHHHSFQLQSQPRQVYWDPLTRTYQSRPIMMQHDSNAQYGQSHQLHSPSQDYYYVPHIRGDPSPLAHRFIPSFITAEQSRHHQPTANIASPLQLDTNLPHLTNAAADQDLHHHIDLSDLNEVEQQQQPPPQQQSNRRPTAELPVHHVRISPRLNPSAYHPGLPREISTRTPLHPQQAQRSKTPQLLRDTSTSPEIAPVVHPHHAQQSPQPHQTQQARVAMTSTAQRKKATTQDRKGIRNSGGKKGSPPPPAAVVSKRQSPPPPSSKRSSFSSKRSSPSPPPSRQASLDAFLNLKPRRAGSSGGSVADGIRGDTTPESRSKKSSRGSRGFGAEESGEEVGSSNNARRGSTPPPTPDVHLASRRRTMAAAQREEQQGEDDGQLDSQQQSAKERILEMFGGSGSSRVHSLSGTSSALFEESSSVALRLSASSGHRDTSGCHMSLGVTSEGTMDNYDDEEDDDEEDDKMGYTDMRVQRSPIEPSPSVTPRIVPKSGTTSIVDSTNNTNMDATLPTHHSSSSMGTTSIHPSPLMVSSQRKSIGIGASPPVDVYDHNDVDIDDNDDEGDGIEQGEGGGRILRSESHRRRQAATDTKSKRRSSQLSIGSDHHQEEMKESATEGERNPEEEQEDSEALLQDHHDVNSYADVNDGGDYDGEDYNVDGEEQHTRRLSLLLPDENDNGGPLLNDDDDEQIMIADDDDDETGHRNGGKNRRFSVASFACQVNTIEHDDGAGCGDVVIGVDSNDEEHEIIVPKRKPKAKAKAKPKSISARLNQWRPENPYERDPNLGGTVALPKLQLRSIEDFPFRSSPSPINKGRRSLTSGSTTNDDGSNPSKRERPKRRRLPPLREYLGERYEYERLPGSDTLTVCGVYTRPLPPDKINTTEAIKMVRAAEKKQREVDKKERAQLKAIKATAEIKPKPKSKAKAGKKQLTSGAAESSSAAPTPSAPTTRKTTKRRKKKNPEDLFSESESDCDDDVDGQVDGSSIIDHNEETTSMSNAPIVPTTTTATSNEKKGGRVIRREDLMFVEIAAPAGPFEVAIVSSKPLYDLCEMRFQPSRYKGADVATDPFIGSVLEGVKDENTCLLLLGPKMAKRTDFNVILKTAQVACKTRIEIDEDMEGAVVFGESSTFYVPRGVCYNIVNISKTERLVLSVTVQRGNYT